MSPATQAAFDEKMPGNWSRANPVDIIGDAGRERYQAALDILLDSDACDAVLVMSCPTALADPEDTASAVVETLASRKESRRKTKSVLTNWLGHSGVAAARRALTAAGIPTYETPADGITSFSYMTTCRAAQKALMRTPSARSQNMSIDPERARAITADAARQDDPVLTEPQAKSVLSAFAIPCVPTRTSSTPDDVAAHAETLLEEHDAVVVKILSEDISHKSDAGGVQLNHRTPGEATFAAATMLKRIRQLHPDARIGGFTVQAVIERPHAFELIAGIAQDPIFGPVIVFGSGGTAVEVIADKAVGLPPLDMKLAHDIVEQTQVYKLLQGYRNSPPVDLEAI